MSYYGSYSVLRFVNHDSDLSSLLWKLGNSLWVRFVGVQVLRANDPVSRRIGLATNYTNIATNKVLCHMRKVALSRITKHKSTKEKRTCNCYYSLCTYQNSKLHALRIIYSNIMQYLVNMHKYRLL